MSCTYSRHVAYSLRDCGMSTTLQLWQSPVWFFCVSLLEVGSSTMEPIVIQSVTDVVTWNYWAMNLKICLELRWSFTFFFLDHSSNASVQSQANSPVMTTFRDVGYISMDVKLFRDGLATFRMSFGHSLVSLFSVMAQNSREWVIFSFKQAVWVIMKLKTAVLLIKTQ